MNNNIIQATGRHVQSLRSKGPRIFIADKKIAWLSARYKQNKISEAELKSAYEKLYAQKYNRLKTIVKDDVDYVKMHMDRPEGGEHSHVIWVCWFQGLKDAPQVVKTCIHKIQKQGFTVRLITWNNLTKYIEIPATIKARLVEKNLSLAIFSDFIRFSLLEKYGGLWLDATVFLIRDIPEDVFDYEIYYPRGIENFRFRGIGAYQFPYINEFVNYCVESVAGGLFVSFMRRATQTVIETHNDTIDYLFGFILAKIARDSFPRVNKQHQQIPLNNIHAETASMVMNFPLTSNEVQVLLSDTNDWLFKLTVNVESRGWVATTGSLWREILCDGISDGEKNE